MGKCSENLILILINKQLMKLESFWWCLFISRICTEVAFDILIGKKVYIYCDKKIENEKIVSFKFRSLRKRIFNIKKGNPYYKHNNKKYFLSNEDLILLSATKKINKLKYKKIIKKLNSISSVPNIEEPLKNNINVDIVGYARTIDEYIASLTKRIGGSTPQSQYLKMSDYYMLIRELRAQKLRYEIINLVIEKINLFFNSFNLKYDYEFSLELERENLDKHNNLEKNMQTHSIDYLTAFNIIYNKNTMSKPNEK